LLCKKILLEILKRENRIHCGNKGCFANVVVVLVVVDDHDEEED
jgi:hypothetical protein